MDLKSDPRGGWSWLGYRFWLTHRGQEVSCGSCKRPRMVSRCPCRGATFLGKKRWTKWVCAILFYLLLLCSALFTQLHSILFLSSFFFFSSPKSQGKVQYAFYSRSQNGQIISQPPLQLEQACDLGLTNQMRLPGI